MSFRRRTIVFVTQAEVDVQLLGDPDIILNIEMSVGDSKTLARII